MTRYIKSWTQALGEVREGTEVKEAVVVETDYKYDGKVVKISKKNFSKVHKDYKNSTKGKETMLINDPKTNGTISVPVQFEEVTLGDQLDQIDEWVIEESAGLQLKMAFDDAGIKVKGVKSGKLVIAKKDKKEVEKIIAKQMKKPSDAKRVLGSQIVFEDVELEEDKDNEAAELMKRRFDDAGIKMKPKDGKIVIAKKDKKRAMDALFRSFPATPVMRKTLDKFMDKHMDKFFIFEDIELEEEFWAVIDKAKGGEVMAVSSDEKGAKSSVKMSNFSKHDYHFGKDPRTLKVVKVMGKHSQKKAEKMIGTKLSFRKEEVEIDEVVNLKKLKKEYEDNEDKNYHRENYLLLAKAFGTRAEIKKVEEIMKRSEANNSTSKADNDWMYKNINKYYDKIRNEEVEIGESQTLQATMALDDVGIKSKWKKGKLYIAKRDVKKAEKALSKSFKKGGEPNLYFEGIDVEKADMKDVIKDFQDSDAPQFKGKSDKKRKEMAIAAKLSREEKEETDEPKSKKKDKINLKPKLDEKQMKKYKELFAGLREKRAQEGTLKKTVSDYHKKEVKEAVTSQGVEYGEQEFDAKYRPDALYPNLNVNFAKYIDEGLEGPYELSGEVYFYDRKVNMFYSVSGEDYVDEETAKDIAYRLHKDGAYKPELGR